MADIDNRIVQMRFDNASFERNAATTLSTLDKLKAKLNFGGAAKGLDNLSAASKKVDMSHLGAGVEAVTAKFGALQVAGIAAFGTIVSQATAAGSQLIKSFTVAPITQGFDEYELKMKSIQTILTNTARHGTTLATVNNELNKLNEYSDKTIYNFAEMTKNASLFTNSGMKIEDATTVIKGFSNAAAASGTGAQEAARAAYQMSQAISAGTVKAIDWISVTNAGMGGKNMQDGLIAVAKGMGTFDGKAAAATEAATNFKGSLDAGWLTADVMSTYLKAMSGDMSDAALAAAGLNGEQIKVLQAQAKMGLDAATKVRTLSALMNTLKESVASGWSQSFEIIFGNFEEATRLFTSVNDYIGGILGASADARNKMLQDWKNNNGRHFLLVGIKNAVQAVANVISPIRDAFREMFPRTTGKQLADLSEAFMNFTKALIPGADTMQRIKSTFEGVFSILKLGVMIVQGFFKVFFGALGTAGAAGGGLLAITATIGEMIRAISDLIISTGIIEKFFKVLLAPLVLIRPFISLVSDLLEAFSKLATGDFSGFGRGITESFTNLGNAFGAIGKHISDFVGSIRSNFLEAAKFFDNLSKAAFLSGNELVQVITGTIADAFRFFHGLFTDFRGTIDGLKSGMDEATSTGRGFLAGFGGGYIEGIKGMISSLVEKFDELRAKMDFGGVFDSFSSSAGEASNKTGGFLSALASAIASLWNGFGNLFSGFGGGLNSMFGALSSFFTTLLEKLREYISKFDMQDLIALINTGTFIAMYAMLGRFFKNMGSLAKDGGQMMENIGRSFGELTDTLKAMQSAIRASVITQIALSVGLLVGALFILAKIDANALKTALVALAVVFAQVAAMLKILTMINPTSMMGAATGMIAIATAIVILAQAIKILGEMDPEVLVQGGVALAALMVALAGMVTILNGMTGIFAAAAGLLILSAALTALTVPLLIFAKIPWDVLEKGMVAMGLALIAIAVGMAGMPKGMILQATGLVILSQALIVFSAAIAVLGALPADVVKQGLIAIGIGLGILAIAANLMKGTLAGAAAMLVMAAAISALVPALIAMGMLDWDTLKQGLQGLAIIMGIFIGSMYLLAPVIAVLAIFAASILLLGTAMLAAGTGFTLFVAALGALVAIGAAGFGVLLVGIAGLINMLPLLAQQLGHGMVAFAFVIGESAPKLAAAGRKLIVAFLNEFDTLIARGMETIGKFMVALAQEISKRVPQLAAAGLDMIIGLLVVIRSRIPMIAILAADIIARFINGLTIGLPRIIESGVNFILSFIEGLADAIRGNRERTGEAGADLAKAIVEGMISGLRAMIGLLPPQIVALGRALVTAFRSFLGINSPSTVFAGFGGDIVMGLINGIGGFVGRLLSKVRELATGAINAAKSAFIGVVAAGAVFVAKLIEGIKSKVSNLGNEAKSLIQGAIVAAKMAGAKALEIGSNIVSGIVRGIRDGVGAVAEAAKNLAKGALDSAMGFLGIKSPSREFIKIGQYVTQGFVEGLTGSSDQIDAAFSTMKTQISSAIESSTKSIADAEVKIKNLTKARLDDINAMKAAQKDLAADQARLKELTSARVKDADAIRAVGLEIDRDKERIRKLAEARKEDDAAIKAATKSLVEARSEKERAVAASKLLTEGMRDESMALYSLANMHESFSKQIEEANKTLENAIKTRDDYNKTITDQYDTLPDISSETSLTDYITDLQQRSIDTNQFADALQQLRNLGLSDEMYKTLLSKGLDAMPFVQEIIKGGAESVNEINEAGTELGEAAKRLGESASTALYQAGVDSAQGLVNGLQSQQGQIYAQMQQIAYGMVSALKQALDIKSPSRVFKKIGELSTDGLAKGLSDSAPGIEKAAGDIGQRAINALKKSIFDISDVMALDMDFQPTITPILDLSNIQKNSVKIGDLLAAPQLSVATSYSTAKSASNGYYENREAASETIASAEAPKSVTFNQYNNSPKALSEAEIYRNTKNQLSRAKGA